MMHLYKPVAIKGQSFKASKKFTVPKQAMTLREIIARFTRKESLPIEKEGFYHERLGDVEKMAREDITVQMERAQKLKEGIARTKERVEREKKAKESPSGGSPPTPPAAPSASAVPPSPPAVPPQSPQGA